MLGAPGEKPVRLFVLLLLAASASAQTIAANDLQPPLPVAPAIQSRQLPEAPRPTHTFLDRQNLSFWAAAAALQTADLITTRQILDRGGRESNPVAKPFVNHGTAAQAASTYLLGTGGTIAAAYLLHRSGHHRLERWLPLCVGAVEAWATASNGSVLSRGNLRGR